jgi:superfamily II DNA helicase RecQ
MAFFTIRALGGEAAEERLNQFLASHSVEDVERHFIAAEANSFWSICVTHVDRGPVPAKKAFSPGSGKDRTDYRELLNDAEFEVFSGLRDVRTEIAERTQIKRFHVATNDQLADMVAMRVRTVEDIAKVPGFSEMRLEKYGRNFVDFLAPRIAALGPPHPFVRAKNAPPRRD